MYWRDGIRQSREHHLRTAFAENELVEPDGSRIQHTLLERDGLQSTSVTVDTEKTSDTMVPPGGTQSGTLGEKT
jgi:hypothetical protein